VSPKKSICGEFGVDTNAVEKDVDNPQALPGGTVPSGVNDFGQISGYFSPNPYFGTRGFLALP